MESLRRLFCSFWGIPFYTFWLDCSFWSICSFWYVSTFWTASLILALLFHSFWFLPYILESQNELLTRGWRSMSLIFPICTALADIVLPIQKVWAVFLTHICRYEQHITRYVRHSQTSQEYERHTPLYERHNSVHIAALWLVNRRNLTLSAGLISPILGCYVGILEIPP